MVKTVTITISQDLYDRLQKLAQRLKMTVDELAEMLLEKALAEHEANPRIKQQDDKDL